jgi:muconolactone delta-isomerase
MEAILASLPLAPWLTVNTTPLSPHPSDPGSGVENEAAVY